MVSTNPLPDVGHVRLFLDDDDNNNVDLADHFYLDIPLEHCRENCLRPAKYLYYLACYITGADRSVTPEGLEDASDFGDDDELEDQGLYLFIQDDTEDDPYLNAIDLEVIKHRTHIYSGTTDTRDLFKEELKQRDIRCVVSGNPADFCQGAHIIPFACGTAWLSLILSHRPPSTDDQDSVPDINHIRNGMLLGSSIHLDVIGQHWAAFLYTPNVALATSDIPGRAQRTIDDDVSYPRDERYTFQWFKRDPQYMRTTPHNSNCTFKKWSNKCTRPSPLLLHYVYAATAVQYWGHWPEALGTYNSNPDNEKRPVATKPSLEPERSTRTEADYKALEAKRTGGGAGAAESASTSNRLEDAKDMVLWFWANSPAGRKQYQARVTENVERIERWQLGSAPHTV